MSFLHSHRSEALRNQNPVNFGHKPVKSRGLNIIINPQDQFQRKVRMNDHLQKAASPNINQQKTLKSFLQSPCQNFCGYNFDQNEYNNKSQIIFSQGNSEANEPYFCYDSSQNFCKSDYINNKKQRPKVQQDMPSTPINKILHIDQDIKLKRIKPKGIMLISSSSSGYKNKKYQSTEVSSQRSIKLFPLFQSD